MKKVALALVFLACLAAPAAGQTVRLQDGSSPNLATVDATGALKTTVSGSAGCTSNVAVSLTGNTRIVTGVVGQRTKLCTVFLLSAIAQNLSVVEGTGATCGTNTAGLIGGAVASIALAINGGFVIATATPTIQTASTGTDVCIFISGAGNVSGVVAYIQQ